MDALMMTFLLVALKCVHKKGNPEGGASAEESDDRRLDISLVDALAGDSRAYDSNDR
jgi:hypothetical protein